MTLFPIRLAITPTATLVAALLLAVLFTTPATAAPPDPGPTLGTNLTWLRPNTGEWPFVDAFKTSLPWVPVQLFGCFACPEAGALDLDDNGWVRSLDASVPNGGQAAVALLFLQAVDMYPAGQYTVLYDGTGSFDYGGSATLVSSQPGRDVIDVDPSNPEPLTITLYQTGPDYARNIRVIMPGGVCSDDAFAACSSDADCGGTCDLFTDNYASQIFHPTFLNNARRFDVIRVMDWLETNQAEHVDYTDYPTLADAHWPMAPLRIIAELGNRLDADLWVTVPHTADNSFIELLATTLRDYLHPLLKVFVQYSGEIWNPDYDQFAYATQAGCDLFTALAAGCADDADPGNGIDCEGHPWPQWNYSCEIARQQYASRRSVDVFDRFEWVFGDTSRLVRVMASQSGNTWLHGGLLGFEDAYRQVDAFATGAYFGWELGGDPQTANLNLDQLFQVLETQEVPATIDAMAADQGFLRGVPEYASIPMIFYEGGQGLVTWGAVEADPALQLAVGDLYEAANGDDRMGDLYDQLLAGWRQQGGGNLLLHYSNVHIFRPWNSYGALTHQDQPHCDSPKYRALVRFIDGVEPCPAP